MANTNFEDYISTYVENDCTHIAGNSDDDDGGNMLNESLKRIINNCKYYDVDNLQGTLFDDTQYKFTSIHINIHSLPSKHDQLINLLSNLHDVDIHINFVMLCETYLTDVNFNSYPIPGYQFIQTNRIKNRGGGVGIYIMDKFQFTLRPDLSPNINSEFESVFAEITNVPKKLIIDECQILMNNYLLRDMKIYFNNLCNLMVML